MYFRVFFFIAYFFIGSTTVNAAEYGWDSTAHMWRCTCGATEAGCSSDCASKGNQNDCSKCCAGWKAVSGGGTVGVQAPNTPAPASKH